ncbi:ABC transporter substrate-binding protein [Chakrabartyella piscis]|uniref:ABC transporter substrate-binding protein n=1 Tax=Chakrabartyella piscis TaxID=2918914 RepID=UPI0029584817|nr:ABC transporter substrate-binding protein [Chakrabartyella piscis]
MKKILAMALASAMVLSLAACGSSSSSASTEETAAPAAEATEEASAEGETYTIGILQLVEHVALDAATQGFQDKLVELLGDSVEFDLQNAQGESTNCTTIATKFVSDEVDLIMANATGAVQAAAAATGTIPIIGTSVTDYATAGVVESNTAPGFNVTGVSDLAPVDQQIDLLLQLVPDAQKVAIIFCSAEPNSYFQSELAQQYITEAGLEFVEYTAADSNEIQAVVTKAASECDSFYIPTDNTMASNMEIIKNIALPAGIPVITGEEGMCGTGGLATLSISYYELGLQAGQVAYEVLVNGADPATTPISFVSENIVAKYNAEAAATLGITDLEGLVPIE